MKKRIGKNDLILMGILLAVGIIFLVMVNLFGKQEGDLVVITVDGENYGTYPLSTDTEVEIVIDGVHTNTLMISDGKAKMTYANCPDKLCMHQKQITKANENIVCLPNRVVATVESSEKSEFDSMAN